MENNIITTKDLEKARKKAARREWFADKKAKVKQFAVEHKEQITVVSTVACVAAIKGAKLLIKAHNLQKEEDLKKLYVYDRSLGHYWHLRRELDNDEWVEIEQRRKNGERLGDILDELKVLK